MGCSGGADSKVGTDELGQSMQFNNWKTNIPVLLCLALFSVSCTCKIEDQSVASLRELTSALRFASSGDIILLEDGVYRMHDKWALQVETDDLTIRGKSGNREKVVIEGDGMHGEKQSGFFINADDVLIADLTIQNVRNHCIQTAPGKDRLHFRNCVFRNAGEQLFKVTTDKENDPSEEGIVEYSLFEYSEGTGPRGYIGGIDVHNGKSWTIRDNIFRFIRSPEGHIAEHAVHFWSNSANTLVERNQIINCDRGIGFGMANSGHKDGVIRNNMIYHSGIPGFNDVGISLESSPGTQVYNNTIFMEHDYPNAIEARFPVTQNVLIANNLSNKIIRMRDGATALTKTNKTNADAKIFIDPSQGNLHLKSEISGILDAGSPVEGLKDDFDKQIRPVGKEIDIGADEYKQNPPTQPTQ